MAWDDTKVANDDFTSSDWNDMVTDQKTRLQGSNGSGAPSSSFIVVELISIFVNLGILKYSSFY